MSNNLTTYDEIKHQLRRSFSSTVKTSTSTNSTKKYRKPNGNLASMASQDRPGR